MTTDADLIRVALDHLDATEHQLGDQGHFFSYREDDDDPVVHITNDAEFLRLGEMLEDGVEDAYSIWFADVLTGRSTIDRVLSLYTETDPDEIEAMATASGDVVTLAALAHLREDFIEAMR